MHNFKDTIEIAEDVIYYCCLIFVVAEYFYRNFRNRTNNEFELYASNSIVNENVSNFSVSGNHDVNINDENRDEIRV